MIQRLFVSVRSISAILSQRFQKIEIEFVVVHLFSLIIMVYIHYFIFNIAKNVFICCCTNHGNYLCNCYSNVSYDICINSFVSDNTFFATFFQVITNTTYKSQSHNISINLCYTNYTYKNNNRITSQN